MKLSLKGMIYAKRVHEATNHKYDGQPYEVHLTMVVGAARRFIDLIEIKDTETVFAAIWCHDVIEDCRQTYNDVREVLGSRVADIVYALTNEKGKNRKERANDKYYNGIRNTPYATFVKLCDRIANMEYSLMKKSSMALKYAEELPVFTTRIFDEKYLPMIDYLYKLHRDIIAEIPAIQPQ